MRFLLLCALPWLTSASALAAYDLKWPDADIPGPPLVHDYIVRECHNYKGFSEERIQDCILEERYGYRAVVMMLADLKRGDGFAERYRDCAVSLGDLGGRFHRRKAECMSTVARYRWRFEFTREAAHDQRHAMALAPGRANPPETVVR